MAINSAQRRHATGMRAAHTRGWRRRQLAGWLLVSGGLALGMYIYGLRPWHMRWGASAAEATMALPGDTLIEQPTQQTTRAITVGAPAAAIWPWLAQLGQGRGGLYSYTWLENLLGCDIHNADAIVPAWQQIKLGDEVRLSRNPMPPPYLIAAIEPNRALILGHHLVLDDPATPWADTWQFVIAPIDAQHTRLILRTRTYQAPWINTLIEPGVFVMERGMLRGIKARAEMAR